jgi:hypothetical protein
VDDFGALIIFAFFILIGVIQRLVKAAKKGQAAASPPPAEGEWQAERDEAIEGLPPKLQELIAEELGINLERKPRMHGPPETALPSATGPAIIESRGPPARGREAVARQRRAEIARRRAETARRRERREERPASLEERLVRERREERPASLEERLVRERGAPVSLERPRRPEDHDRFHERYRVPEPVASHTDFHERYMEAEAGPAQRGRRLRLPERRDWSAVKKAIVWAEVLGPPKGLEP